MENNLISRYKNQRGNMLSSLRRTNPKYFYKKFRKLKKTDKTNISMDDFVHHLKKLVSWFVSSHTIVVKFRILPFLQ
jgi:hypothetical protein